VGIYEECHRREWGICLVKKGGVGGAQGVDEPCPQHRRHVCFRVHVMCTRDREAGVLHQKTEAAEHDLCRGGEQISVACGLWAGSLQLQWLSVNTIYL
jgi:hypothetical protein